MVKLPPSTAWCLLDTCLRVVVKDVKFLLEHLLYSCSSDFNTNPRMGDIINWRIFR